MNFLLSNAGQLPYTAKRLADLTFAHTHIPDRNVATNGRLS
jgi:hypothetical protein